MDTYSYKQSQALFERAVNVIPCGVPGHMSPAVNIPPSAYPIYAARAEGACFWDVDGNEFIDYMCGYGPMILGYRNPVVDGAARRQADEADLTMCASPKMVELAEALVDTVDAMDWAFFAKNGGDVTNYAAMVARSATGRKKIVAIKGGYHGVAPWMQALGHHGILEEDHAHTLRIPWNDTAAFEKVIAEHPGNVAGFIATPYHVPTFYDNVLPDPGYWQKIEAICRKEGIVLIVDDIRHGFRLNMKGSHVHYGFTPDLVCYCKALANGYPISALMGTEAMKNEAAKVFYTGSYWYQAVPMAAALACLEELKRLDAPAWMLKQGADLFGKMESMAANYGFHLKVTGEPSMPNVRLTDDPSGMLHQAWCAECTKRGAFFASHHNWFISTAHDDEVVARTLAICDEAFQVIKDAAEKGRLAS